MESLRPIGRFFLAGIAPEILEQFLLASGKDVLLLEQSQTGQPSCSTLLKVTVRTR